MDVDSGVAPFPHSGPRLPLFQQNLYLSIHPLYPPPMQDQKGLGGMRGSDAASMRSIKSIGSIVLPMPDFHCDWMTP
jgi:hypothetical protein